MQLRSCQEERNEATRFLEMTTQALVLQGFGGFLIQERLRRSKQSLWRHKHPVHVSNKQRKRYGHATAVETEKSL